MATAKIPHAGRFPTPRTAAAVASAAQSTPVSHSWPSWFTRVAPTIPGQIPTQFDPRSVDFDELRQAAAARLAAGAASAAARAPFTLSRQIVDQRARLDLNPSHPEPLDLDPTVWIQAYRFGLALFLKRPSAFPYLTRRPSLFKSNYG